VEPTWQKGSIMKRSWPLAWMALLLGGTACANDSYPRSIPLPPGCPEPRYQQLQVTSRDGTRLAVHEWSPPPPVADRPVVLLIHGIGFHGAPYAAIAAGFTWRGLILAAPDLRGHGRSGGTCGELVEAHVLRADIEAVIDQISRRYPGRPLILAGESMGSLIAGDYAWRGEKRLDGLALLVPAFGVHPGRILSNLQPRPGVDLKNLLAGQLSLDSRENLEAASREPAFVKARQADPLALRTVEPSYLLRIVALQAECLKGAGEVTQPLFVGLAGHDQVVNNLLAERFFRAAGTLPREKTWRRWDPVYHTLFWDPVAPQVVQELATWALKRGQKP
jgi:alpha-beta hydrolase superfamily lysophospholipase